MEKSAKNQNSSCNSFPAILLAALASQWKEEHFCDVTLEVEGRKFKCHKNILAANSEYLTTMLPKDANWTGLIVMPAEFQIAPFETLLEYFYSGNLVLSSENVEGVFKLAHHMGLNKIFGSLTEITEETLKKLSSVQRFILLDKIDGKSPCLEEAYKDAARLIVEEALQDTASEAFLQLNPKQISKIVSLNSQQKNAENLFCFIVKCVSQDEENRQPFLNKLLESIPVSGLSCEFYETKIKCNEVLRRNPEGVQWLLDAAAPRSTNSVWVWPESEASLFLTDRDAVTSSCYQFFMSDPALMMHSWDRPDTKYFTSISYKSRMYLICGHTTTKTFMIEKGKRDWTESNVDLYFDRCHAGCAVIGDDLFVVGGWLQNKTLNSCVQFNLAKEQTISMPSMSVARYDIGVAVYENSVYASCGVTDQRLIERFDPREGKWAEIGSYKQIKGYCSSAAVGNYLYSCDILTGQTERFDFRTGGLESVCSLLKNCEKYYWITSLNDEVYAAQGHATIAKYDKINDSWVNFPGYVNVRYPILTPWI